MFLSCTNQSIPTEKAKVHWIFERWRGGWFKRVDTYSNAKILRG